MEQVLYSFVIAFTIAIAFVGVLLFFVNMNLGIRKIIKYVEEIKNKFK